jgi:RNA-binding protein 5/10
VHSFSPVIDILAGVLIQLIDYLRTHHRASVETTTIIKDKASGLSKGFGFALFSTLSGAEEFVNTK